MSHTFFAQAAAVSAAPAEGAAAPQPDAVAVEAQPADVGTAPAAPQQPGGMSMLVPMLLIFAIFYFMMIRPQQRKEKERRKMIDDLRAGARVAFAGGFIGVITEAKEKTFRIEIADGVVVEVARAAVQSVVAEDAPAAK